MTKKQTERIAPGLYRVHWKDGGTSLAAIGLMYDGQRWCAPTNWAAPANHVGSGYSPGGYGTKFWRQVASVTLFLNNADERDGL